MQKGCILIIIFLLINFLAFSQKKYPNKGVGLTGNLTGFFLPKNSENVIISFPQVHFTYLQSPKQKVTILVGILTDFSKTYFPWSTFSYSRLINFNPKKKTHLFYGASMDVCLGKFSYAIDKFYPGYPILYYKRCIGGLSAHTGILIKSGKKNYFSASLSVGAASLFAKITTPPGDAYYIDPVFVISSLKLEYTFMFKRK